MDGQRPSASRQKRSPAFGRARLAPLSETEIAGRSVAAVLAAAEANGFNPSDEAEDKAQALSGSCWIHRHCCPGTFGPRRQGLLKTGLFRNPRWSRQEMINRARFAAGPAAFGRDATREQPATAQICGANAGHSRRSRSSPATPPAFAVATPSRATRTHMAGRAKSVLAFRRCPLLRAAGSALDGARPCFPGRRFRLRRFLRTRLSGPPGRGLR